MSGGAAPRNKANESRPLQGVSPYTHQGEARAGNMWIVWERGTMLGRMHLILVTGERAGLQNYMQRRGMW